jgi:short-subunit dehydrogenase
MSSVLGLAGAAQVSDYAASKAALISLNDSLRYELDKRYNAPGIRTSLFVPGHIFTPLFSRAKYPSGRLFQFFFPSLHPVEVAKAVIRALDDQHSQVVYMPFFSNFAPLVRTLPSFLRDFVQWVRTACDPVNSRACLLTPSVDYLR